MDTINSVLFVCWGNICRSPSAENVMRSLLDKAGLANEIRCDSAGTIAAHQGQGPDPRMSAAGKRRGLAMTGRARKVTAKDFDEFDLIIAMDHENYADLIFMSPSKMRSEKIEMFCKYCEEHDDEVVPDPYYGGPQGFELVLDLLEDGCQGILTRIQESR